MYSAVRLRARVVSTEAGPHQLPRWAWPRLRKGRTIATRKTRDCLFIITGKDGKRGPTWAHIETSPYNRSPIRLQRSLLPQAQLPHSVCNAPCIMFSTIPAWTPILQEGFLLRGLCPTICPAVSVPVSGSKPVSISLAARTPPQRASLINWLPS